MNFSFKRVLAVLAALVVVYMAKSVFVDPRLASYGEEADAYSQAAKTLDGRTRVATNVRSKEAEFKQRLDKVLTALPAKTDLDQTLSAMRQAFESSGVTWTAFNPQPLPAPPPVTAPPSTIAQERPSEAKAATVTVPTTVPAAEVAPKAIKASISIRGTRANVQRAYDALKALDRLVVIDSVTLNFEGGQARSAIEVRMFVYVPPDPPAIVEPSGAVLGATTPATTAR